MYYWYQQNKSNFRCGTCKTDIINNKCRCGEWKYDPKTMSTRLFKYNKVMETEKKHLEWIKDDDTSIAAIIEYYIDRANGLDDLPLGDIENDIYYKIKFLN